MFKALLEGLQPLLTGVLAFGIIVVTMWCIEPKYITHPSHFMPDVPDELIINEVKEYPREWYEEGRVVESGCHERAKQWMMSAGQFTKKELDPRVTTIMCGR